MSEQYRRVGNRPIPSPPNDVFHEEDPDIWVCPLCEHRVRWPYGHGPRQCPNCGQVPKREVVNPSDWGAKEE